MVYSTGVPLNHKLKIQAELRRRGINPAEATLEQYNSAAIGIRSPFELIRDGTKIAYSTVQVEIRRKEVPLEIYKQREAICQGCEFMVILKGGESACDACNCSNNRLKLKLRSEHEECPQKKWGPHNAD